MERAQGLILQHTFQNHFELILVCLNVIRYWLQYKLTTRDWLGVPGKGMDRGTPKVLVDNPGNKVKSEEIRQSYKKKIGLKCTKGCILSEVITCYSRRGDNKTGEQSKPHIDSVHNTSSLY